jgi:hypothetical protein
LDDVNRLRGHRGAHGCRARALSWCAARLSGAELDVMLAEGVRPDELTDVASRQRCEARARLLERRSFRLTLAAQIEDVLRLAAEPRARAASSAVWAVDVQLEQLREAGASLQQIVAGLRQSSPPRAQGVALALLLLRHGRSPLYAGRAPGELELAAQATARALAAPVSWVQLGSSRTVAASCWWQAPARAPKRSPAKGLESDE